MILKYFYDEQLAQASYLVACAATGEAVVIDPARDVAPYLAVADQEGVQITHVAETHIHADFVSGSRELAARTGAMIYLSEMGDENWQYGYRHQANVIRVRDQDTFMVGNIRIQVLHTPGHTLEHIAFVVTDTAGADRPMGIFTGDFLFVGDVGRPDLLEAVAGAVGTKEAGARQQFATIQQFKQMPDYLQIWPGHGAGSACGKSLGAIPTTTLGYEKLFNPAFQFDKEADFVNWLLADQPEPPIYFAQMKRINKDGPALLSELPPVEQLDTAVLHRALAENALILDLRSREEFVAAHVPGTLSIPANNRSFTTFAGWFVDYERPTYLIVPSAEQVPQTLTHLRSIGVDRVPGYFTPDVTRQGESLPVISAQELAQLYTQNEVVVLDVRGQGEYCTEHIRDARHITLGYLPQHLEEIPRDQKVVVQCASGYRSQIGTSYLRANGFTNVVSLKDDQKSWSKVLPTESCGCQADPAMAGTCDVKPVADALGVAK